MSINLVKSLLLLSITLLSLTLKGSHTLGGEITYKRIQKAQSIVQIEFTLKLYRDPSGLAYGNTQTIDISNPNLILNNFTVYLDTVFSTLAGCNDTIETYVYLAVNNFHFTSIQGKTILSWNECCRPDSIANISNSATQGLYIQTKMRGYVYPSPTYFYPHSSIQFYDAIQFFYQTDSVVKIDFAAFSPEGDSLTYTLIAPKQMSGTNITKVTLDSSYSVTHPFDTNTVTTFNSKTGLLTVNNPPIGKYTIACRVDAYRNGSFMNFVKKDITLIIKPNQAIVSKPTTAIKNMVLSQGSWSYNNNILEINTQENQTVSFDFEVTPTPLATGQSKYFEAVATGELLDKSCTGFNCATFTALNGNLKDTVTITGHFNLSIDTNFVEHLDSIRETGFVLKGIAEDSCGVKYVVNTYVILKVRNASITVDTNTLYICKGDTAVSEISGDITNLNWIPSAGVSNTSGGKVNLFPSITTTYTVWNLNDSSHVSVHVQVDTLFGQFSIFAGGFQYVNLPTNLHPYPNQWYYMDIPIVKNSINSKAYLNGIYSTTVFNKGCTNFSDSLYINRTNHARTAYLDSGERKVIPLVREFSVDFKPLQHNVRLTNIFLIFKLNSVSNPRRMYRIFDKSNNNKLVEGLVNSNPITSVATTYKLSLQLDTAKEYLLVIYPKDFFGSWDIPSYRPPQYPYKDNNNLVKFYNSRYIVNSPVIDTGWVPYLDFAFSLSNIGLEEDVLAEAKVYPNPFEEIINVEIDGSGSLILLDSFGRKLFESKIEQSLTIVTDHLKPGVYILWIKTTEGQRSFKVVK